MQSAQWVIAAVTAIFVAAVAYLQWRTAQQKAVLDLFDRRRAIYDIVRKAVGTIAASSPSFDQPREFEYMQAMEDAFFFFGDDVDRYVRRVWSDIQDVRTADMELQGTPDTETRRAILEKRGAAMRRIAQFHSDGMPLFARYMRFSQTVPARMLDRFLCRSR